jgi:hypothetical protein
MSAPGSVMATALLRNRNRRRCRALQQSCSAWTLLTPVEAGMYVTVDGGNTLLLAQSSGTTGSVQPSYPSYSDTIAWSIANSQSLLTYLYSPSGVPTP